MNFGTNLPHTTPSLYEDCTEVYKAAPVRNSAPRYGDIWRSEGIAPRDRNLGTRWR